MLSEWQICLSLIGSFYLIKTLFAIILDLKVFITTYVLPTISLNKGSFDKKYGKWAVVTGCTQGIGRSYVDELAKRGMSVVLISRNKEKLEKVSEEVKRVYKGDMLFKVLYITQYFIHFILPYQSMLFNF